MTGNVPYQEFQSEFSIYRALDKKQFPKRPPELPESDERATRLWALLVQCWDHDPEARPTALSVLEQVSWDTVGSGRTLPRIGALQRTMSGLYGVVLVLLTGSTILVVLSIL